MLIQPEVASHHTAVRQLHIAAFPSSAEAELVERLRTDGDAVISLVALEDNAVVGHAMFSRMRAPFKALGLAPVSVDAHRRRRGIAARLIEEGIARARAGGWDGVFVVGDPAYYRRFGFDAEAAVGFESSYAGPYLMLLSLNDAGPPATSGRVDYAAAFAALDGAAGP